MKIFQIMKEILSNFLHPWTVPNSVSNGVDHMEKKNPVQYSVHLMRITHSM